MKRNLTLLSLIFVLCSSKFSAQIFRGINLTGFTYDVIAESTPATATTGSVVTIDATGYVLYSALYTNTTTLGGLPAVGVFTTTTRTYSLASYAQKNGLRVAFNAKDSLALSTPQSFSVLSLLGFSSGIDASVDVTVKFADGSSALYPSMTLYNWSSTQPAILEGFGKTKRSTDAIYYTATEPKMFSLDIPIACTNQSKKISRVVVKNNTNGATVWLFSGAGVDKAGFVTSSTPAVCKGTASGTAKALGVDMFGPVSYTWMPGGQTTQTATNLSAGTYTVSIIDGNGCAFTKTVAVTEPATAFSITSVNSTSVACVTATTGGATVTVAGGNSPYTYTWANTTPVTSTLTSNSISSLSSGVYSVSVQDNNGCVLTGSTTVAKPAVTISISTASLLCGTTANGSATVTSVTGTTGALTYSWVPAAQSGSVATGLSAGTYTVRVTDAANCVNTQTTSIAAPDFSLTTAGTTCTLSTGSATVSNITGGSGGPYTYSWSPAGGNAATATGLSSGNYTVTVRDVANCLIVKTFNLASLNPTLTVATSSLLCGTVANGSATVTAVTGGTGPFTYTWMPTAQTTSVATGLGAGIYSITVKGASGCVTTQTIQIAQPSISVASSSTSCKGLQPTGSATVTSVTGGVGPYTYSWDATDMPGIAIGSMANGLDEGSYTVTVTDANNCKTSTTFSVTGSTTAGLTAVTSASATTCSGINDGKAKVTATGGLMPYAYYWNTNPPQYTATVTGLPSPNTFICSVIDFNGCLLTKPVTIFPEPQNILIYAAPSNTICPGASAQLSITGLSGTGTYTWSTGATTKSITVTPTNTLTVYTITGTATSSCIVTGSTSIITSTNAAASCPTSIREQSATSFNLYPNPNNGQFVLALGQIEDNAVLEVVDALGKLVLTQSVTGLETTVNTTSLQNGMYFVIVRDENKIIVRTKVIKQ
jgi:hypothetical protein